MSNPTLRGPTGRATPPAVHLAGSTTLLPRIQRAAEAFMTTYPDATIVIVGAGGTARGYKALLDRTVDIAMASGNLPQQLASRVADQRTTLRSTVLSHEAIVPLVHISNPVTSLSMRQLRNIFSGRISNWREVGGRDAPIEVLAGMPTGGVFSSLKKLVLGNDDTFTPGALVLGTADRLARCADRPFAISYVPHMPLPDRRLKMLRVDGIEASRSAPAYPLRLPMMLVTHNAPSTSTRAFIAYAVASGEAEPAAGDKHE